MVPLGQHGVMTRRATRRPLLVDLGLVLAVALLLAAVHLLVPRPLQEALAFHHGTFNVHGLLTSAYVHASDAHLRNNLVGYLLAALYTLVLCQAAGERPWFRRTLALLLLVVPVLVSLGSYAVFQLRYPGTDPVSRGFSGVVAGFGGFLLVALAAYVRTRYSPALGRAVGAGTVLLLLVEVDLVTAGRVRPVVAGLAALGVLLLLGSLAWAGALAPTALSDRAVLTDAVAVVLVVAVLSLVVVNLFPADVVRDGALTNVFAHALGFALGAATAFATNESLVPRL